MHRIQLYAIALLSGLTVVIPLTTPLLAASNSSSLEPQTPVRVSQTPPGVAAPELSPFETRVWREINSLRTNPSAYADWLESQRVHFNGNLLEIPGEPTITTQEGVDALDEAIRFLREARPLLPLQLSPGMSKAAQDHVEDQGQTGQTGHTGSDGSAFFERLSRYGLVNGPAAENITYGEESARIMVMRLILDDGLPQRTQRNNLFNIDFKFMGLACGSHPTLTNMCTINLAGAYQEQTVATPPQTPPETPPTTPSDPDTTPTPPTSTSAGVILIQEGVLQDGDPMYEDGSLYHEHRFRGEEGQAVTIRLESDEFDTFLAVLNEDGTEVLAQNDDISEDDTNSLIQMTLPYNGIYRVFVNGYHPTDRGRYRLVIY
ncbi:CAP domain-containing protein [Spirulina subsalsa FACHB-351]|uniref:CAP domain-containing protein n=1 Tax=Spirulina subsalsa FACHB-351 TaxID=234711 RepID=A0ABT3L2I7_9CYAN|nr:CAP domain-containing protein [Spirulina subsalsa]MCW6035672.1 CAP domain-containing protein [Spirulina subsalsa FACHB-351]